MTDIRKEHQTGMSQIQNLLIQSFQLAVLIFQFLIHSLQFPIGLSQFLVQLHLDYITPEYHSSSSNTYQKE